METNHISDLELLGIGMKKWTSNGQAIFDLGKNIKRGLVDGQNNSGLYEFTYKHKNYFVKGLHEVSNVRKREPYDDVRVAKILNRLGVGPETDIVIIKDRFYIVMQKAPGINIQEIVYEETMTPKTIKNVQRVLDNPKAIAKTTSIRDTRILFARQMMHDPSFETQLIYLDKLFKYHGIVPWDLQFLVAFRNGKTELNIIDVGGFIVAGKGGERFDSFTLRDEITDFLDLIRSLSRQRTANE